MIPNPLFPLFLFHAISLETPPQKRSKGVRVLPLVVLPTRLGNEQRRVLLAVVMMGAVPGPLDQRPKALNRVRVQPAVHVGVLLLMIDDRVRQEIAGGLIALVLVRH